MSYFAKVIDGIVEQVIVSDKTHIDTLKDSKNWVETFPDKSGYAAIGYFYDKENNIFYAKKPFESWVLNKTTWLWETPSPYPLDGKKYIWDEASISWKELK